MTTFITGKHNGLRTFYLEDREVRGFSFYRDGAVVLHSRSGWIEQEGGTGRRDMNGLLLSHPLRRSTKLNLEKGGHFFISGGKPGFDGKPVVHVYIDLALRDCALGEEQDVMVYENDSGMTYQKLRALTAVFDIDGPRRMIRMISGPHYTVHNAYGTALATIQAYIKASGQERHITGIEAILKDKPLLDLLVAAQALVPKPPVALPLAASQGGACQHDR